MWSREGTNNNQKGNGADNPGRSRSRGSRRGDIATGQERSESQGRTPREVDHATGWGLDPQHSRSSDDVRRSRSPRIIVTHPEVVEAGTAAVDQRVPTPTSAHSSVAPEITVTDVENVNTGSAANTSPEIDITNRGSRRSSSHRRSLDVENVNTSPEIDITNSDRRRSSSQRHSLDIEPVNTGSADTHNAYKMSRLSQKRDLEAFTAHREERIDISSSQDADQSSLLDRALRPDIQRIIEDLRIEHREEAQRQIESLYGILEKSLAKAFPTYTQRVIKDLRIQQDFPGDVPGEIKSLYRILVKSEKATSERDYEKACNDVLSLAPDQTIVRSMRKGEIGKVYRAIVFGEKKTRLETNNLRMRGELEIAIKSAAREYLSKLSNQVTDEQRTAIESAAREYLYRLTGELRIARGESAARKHLSRLSDRVTHELAWRLNEPVYRAGLASVLGVASTLTPLAYGGEFEPMAIPINVAATYLDTVIFKKFNYPWNLLITTGVWQGSSFATEYSQLGVDKLTKAIQSGSISQKTTIEIFTPIAGATVAALSIWTIVKCRQDRNRERQAGQPTPPSILPV